MIVPRTFLRTTISDELLDECRANGELDPAQYENICRGNALRLLGEA